MVCILLVSVCLFGFVLSTSYKLELSGKKNLSWEDDFIQIAYRQVCRAFCKLVIDVGGPSPFRVV